MAQQQNGKSKEVFSTVKLARHSVNKSYWNNTFAAISEKLADFLIYTSMQNYSKLSEILAELQLDICKRSIVLPNW